MSGDCKVGYPSSSKIAEKTEPCRGQLLLSGLKIMHEELYTDGVDEITVSGTIVRVDLFSLSPNDRDTNNPPKKVFRQRLIFSAEGFANSVDIMQSALRGLVEAGVVTRGQPQAGTSVQGRERSPGNSEGPQNVSTNFR